MTEATPQPRVFYGGLNWRSVLGVTNPHARGADEDLVTDFLEEAELDVQNEIGDLPYDSDGNHDRIVRAVIRDLAAGRTILRLVGTDNDEGRRAGESLINFAWERLRRWQESKHNDTDTDSTNRVHNIFPHPLFNDPKSPPQRRLGGEWPGE